MATEMKRVLASLHNRSGPPGKRFSRKYSSRKSELKFDNISLIDAEKSGGSYELHSDLLLKAATSSTIGNTRSRNADECTARMSQVQRNRGRMPLPRQISAPWEGHPAAIL